MEKNNKNRIQPNRRISSESDSSILSSSSLDSVFSDLSSSGESLISNYEEDESNLNILWEISNKCEEIKAIEKESFYIVFKTDEWIEKISYLIENISHLIKLVNTWDKIINEFISTFKKIKYKELSSFFKSDKFYLNHLEYFNTHLKDNYFEYIKSENESIKEIKFFIEKKIKAINSNIEVYKNEINDEIEWIHKMLSSSSNILDLDDFFYFNEWLVLLLKSSLSIDKNLKEKVWEIYKEFIDNKIDYDYNDFEYLYKFNVKAIEDMEKKEKDEYRLRMSSLKICFGMCKNIQESFENLKKKESKDIIFITFNIFFENLKKFSEKINEEFSQLNQEDFKKSVDEGKEEAEKNLFNFLDFYNNNIQSLKEIENFEQEEVSELIQYFWYFINSYSFCFIGKNISVDGEIKTEKEEKNTEKNSYSDSLRKLLIIQEKQERSELEIRDLKFSLEESKKVQEALKSKLELTNLNHEEYKKRKEEELKKTISEIKENAEKTYKGYHSPAVFLKNTEVHKNNIRKIKNIAQKDKKRDEERVKELSVKIENTNSFLKSAKINIEGLNDREREDYRSLITEKYEEGSSSVTDFLEVVQQGHIFKEKAKEAEKRLEESRDKNRELKNENLELDNSILSIEFKYKEEIEKISLQLRNKEEKILSVERQVKDFEIFVEEIKNILNIKNIEDILDLEEFIKENNKSKLEKNSHYSLSNVDSEENEDEFDSNEEEEEEEEVNSSDDSDSINNEDEEFKEQIGQNLDNLKI